MKKTLLSTFSGVVLALSLFGISGCNRGGSGNLATINGEVISMDDFHKYIETKPQVQVIVENGSVATARVANTIAFQGLQDMIVNKLMEQLAKDQAIYPTDAEVVKELEFQKRLNPSYMSDKINFGYSVERIKTELALQLCSEKMLTKGVIVTDDEVTKWIQDNPNDFTKAASATLKGILVKNQADQSAVDTDLNTGADFTTVALRYSKFPNVQESKASLGDVPLKSLTPELRKAIESTPLKQTTTWQKIPEGFAKFFIENRAADTKLTPTPDQLAALKRQLAKDRGAQAIDLNSRIMTKLKESSVKVDEKTLQKAWELAVKRIESGDAADKAK